MRRFFSLLPLLLLALPLAAQVPAPIDTDPMQDKNHPAAMEAFQLPSHGSMLNALMYEAAGTGPHGTVVLLHGFPGNEKNLDLAQTIRRDGWNVLYFDYRGSWGSPGAFSFQHSMEDAQAAVAYLRDPSVAAHLRANPEQIVLMGHSMGGMIALYTAAHDAKILAVGVFSASDMASRATPPAGASPEAQKEVLTATAKWLTSLDMLPLSGCTAEGLAAELAAHPEWSLLNDAPGLKSKPVLLVTSDDGGAVATEKLAEAISAEGNEQIRIVHIATDHSFSDKRIALETEMISGLDYVKTQ